MEFNLKGRRRNSFRGETYQRILKYRNRSADGVSELFQADEHPVSETYVMLHDCGQTQVGLRRPFFLMTWHHDPFGLRPHLRLRQRPV